MHYFMWKSALGCSLPRIRVRLEPMGREQAVYDLQHMSLIHDMEITAGGNRIVTVGRH